MEEELKITLGDADRRLSFERQIDLIHVWREVKYSNMELIETRRQYVNEVKGILLKLRSFKKHE